MRDEDVVLVLGREHLAGVEAHAERRDVRAELQRRRRRTPCTSGSCRTPGRACRPGGRTGSRSSCPSCATRFSVSFGRSSPSQSRPWLVNHSCLVFGCQSKPTELRTPCATFSITPVFGSTRDDRRLHVGRHDDVAGRADVEVQLAVRAHREEFPEVAGLLLRIEVVDHDLGLGRIVEPVLDAVVARDAVALGDVQRALAERDAVGRVQALQDRLDLALAAVVDDRVDVLRDCGC